MNGKYYYLQKGDYLQQGDEYKDYRSAPHRWRPIDESWIGCRWGYNPEKPGELYDWAPVRRIAPKRSAFRMEGPDLWGEEFELSPEEIRAWRTKNEKK